MHGLIFAALRGYLEEGGGPAVAWEAMGERTYALHRSHPDELLVEAIERACTLMERGPVDLIHDFGVFTGRDFFPKRFPMLYAPHTSVRSFLPVVDEQIHTIVRKTAPGALTPGLGVHQDGDALIIAYSSARKLCVYLGGLIEGTAGYFGETAAFVEPSCMLRGDSACLFRVELSR